MKRLAQYHSHIAIVWNATAGEWELNPVTINYNEGVELFTPTNRNFVAMVSKKYIDLAGLSMEDETIFPKAITNQEAYLPTISSGQAGDQIWIYDIVTSVALDDDVDWAYVYLNGAGFPGGVLNFEHVLYQRLRRYTLDIDTGQQIPLLINDEQSGSLEPTASDRLYVYRLVVFYNLSGASIAMSTPTSRVLVLADAKEEPEYQYLMRLKRSYDLQNEPDRD